jgi:hypothetical protein
LGYYLKATAAKTTQDDDNYQDPNNPPTSPAEPFLGFYIFSTHNITSRRGLIYDMAIFEKRGRGFVIFMIGPCQLDTVAMSPYFYSNISTGITFGVFSIRFAPA